MVDGGLDGAGGGAGNVAVDVIVVVTVVTPSSFSRTSGSAVPSPMLTTVVVSVETAGGVSAAASKLSASWGGAASVLASRRCTARMVVLSIMMSDVFRYLLALGKFQDA
ncbi:hypothetical protein IAQ61_006884 [Plenodomus lingam]|uniref:uncharacterized protein n=1 Tax=Leptosphaeria maculans TaxID=5022 RepID=UPI0033225B4F|nr:hypothetical protein IAQ61_006884 [Plenodomus lingam]